MTFDSPDESKQDLESSISIKSTLPLKQQPKRPTPKLEQNATINDKDANTNQQQIPALGATLPLPAAAVATPAPTKPKPTKQQKEHQSTVLTKNSSSQNNNAAKPPMHSGTNSSLRGGVESLSLSVPKKQIKKPKNITNPHQKLSIRNPHHQTHKQHHRTTNKTHNKKAHRKQQTTRKILSKRPLLKLEEGKDHHDAPRSHTLQRWGDYIKKDVDDSEYMKKDVDDSDNAGASKSAQRSRNSRKLSRKLNYGTYGSFESAESNQQSHGTHETHGTHGSYQGSQDQDNSDSDTEMAVMPRAQTMSTSSPSSRESLKFVEESEAMHRFKWRKRAATVTPPGSSLALPGIEEGTEDSNANHAHKTRATTPSNQRSKAKIDQVMEESDSDESGIIENRGTVWFMSDWDWRRRSEQAIDIIFLAFVYIQPLGAFMYESRSGIDKYPGTLDVISLVCAVSFTLEVVYRSMIKEGGRFINHAKSRPIDTFLCATALLVEIATWGRVEAILRAMRVVRVVTTNKRLSKLVKSILTEIQTVLWLLVLLLIIFYIFVVIGMQTFSYRAIGKTHSYRNIESFDGFWSAMLSLFQITTTNNWNDVMFTVLPDTRLAYSLYFISFYFIVCMVVLNVVTTLIIQGFSRNQEFIEEESWRLRTKDGLFEIRRVEPWSHQAMQEARSDLRDKDLLKKVQDLLMEDKVIERQRSDDDPALRMSQFSMQCT